MAWPKGRLRSPETRAKMSKSHRNRPRPPKIERFLRRITIAENGCWLWDNPSPNNGYGSFNTGYGVISAHKFSYEWFVGPVPDGLDLDHKCHNEDSGCSGGRFCLHRACVNYEHLVPATRSENLTKGKRRGYAAPYSRIRCRNGHPSFSIPCQECARARKREFRKRIKEKNLCLA